jgi:hypothetical protein
LSNQSSRSPSPAGLDVRDDEDDVDHHAATTTTDDD